MHSEKQKILIVEDEYIIGQNLKMKLEEMGYEVTAVLDNGEDAIKMVKVDRPNIILMDIMLNGDLDGIETTINIKKIIDVPFIYTTAYSSDSFLKRAKETRPYGYVIKPYSDRELLIAIELALSKYEAEVILKQEIERLKKENKELKEKLGISGS